MENTSTSSNKNNDGNLFLQTALPQASSDFPAQERINWTKLVILIVGISSFVIMVCTKLCPIIRVSWPQDFCERLNDLLFGLSTSLFAAIVFYFFFNVMQSKDKRKKAEPFINLEISTILVHMNMMYCLATGRYARTYVLQESFVEEFVSFDWEKNYLYENGRLPFLECVNLELNYVKTKLDAVSLKYKGFLSEKELAVLTQSILHHKIFSTTAISLTINPLSIEQKTKIASELYDFYWKIIDFSTKFEHKNMELGAF